MAIFSSPVRRDGVISSEPLVRKQPLQRDDRLRHRAPASAYIYWLSHRAAPPRAASDKHKTRRETLPRLFQHCRRNGMQRKMRFDDVGTCYPVMLHRHHEVETLRRYQRILDMDEFVSYSLDDLRLSPSATIASAPAAADHQIGPWRLQRIAAGIEQMRHDEFLRAAGDKNALGSQRERRAHSHVFISGTMPSAAASAFTCAAMPALPSVMPQHRIKSAPSI